jgi:hypothetical protein
MGVQYFTIQKGKLINRTAVGNRFKELADGDYRMEIAKAKKRSLNQNSYLHGVLFPELSKAFTEQGYEPMNPEIAKLVAKKMFMTRYTINPNTGQGVEYVQDTSDASTIEINEFIEAVIRFAAEHLNYIIPMPNEQLTLHQ